MRDNDDLPLWTGSEPPSHPLRTGNYILRSEIARLSMPIVFEGREIDALKLFCFREDLTVFASVARQITLL